MQNRNPYAAPHANVGRGDDPGEYGEVRVLSASGRLGRLRYIGYTFGVSILIFILIGIASGLAALADPAAAVTVAALGYVALIVVQFLLTIQRAHDMNVTGWLALISLVPLAFLVFWLVPGTPGENDYGKQPPPNTGGVIALACLLPFGLIFGVGMLAAIAIPAYQDYTLRAQISEGLNLAAGPKAAVAEAYMRGGVAPLDRSAAGLSADATDTSGKYVSSIDVVGGTLVVTYGAEANGMIAGSVLGLQPYVTADRKVVWRCGEGATPQGAFAMDPRAPSATDVTEVDPRHLPSACRP